MPNKTFVVIKTGGKQYRVSKGDKLKVEKLAKKEGSDITFKDVLLYVDGSNAEIGTPKVSSVKVVGRVLEHGKNDKVIVYKYKKRKRQSTKKGHRQPYTKIEITEISKGSSTAKKASTKKKTAAKKAPAKKTTAAKK